MQMITKERAARSAIVEISMEPRERIAGGDLHDLGIPRPSLKTRPQVRHRLSSLHSRRDINVILHRESARCERNGHSFTMVVIAGAEVRGRNLYRLAKVLCRTARGTDEIGWFDRSRLCAVLPDTDAEGGMAFIRKFAENSYFRGLSPICNLLSYSGRSQVHSQSMDMDQILGNSAVSREVGGIREAGSSFEGMEACSIAEEYPRFLKPENMNDLGRLLVHPLPSWKRAIDLAVASTAIVFALPLMGIAAVAIKLTDRGPVFFKQKRAGLGGRPFTIFKFRTMVVGAEKKQAELRGRSDQDGPAFKMKHDPRITRIGRFLRETSLDELPQLLNVIRGDMSLVGPRPLPLHESDRCDIWHRRRLDVTPGLTCIWQVHGRSKVSFADWVRMDRTYIRARSVWQDLKLMVMTIPSVILRRGAR
jgi:lipopolysaccharide/colanic/teichoic acid biosynthesis glycosyltransferase